MALPVPSNDNDLQSIIRVETEKLTSDLEAYESYRDYYAGDQTLTFATDEFKAAFGDQFSTFRDNWCQVVVDAVTERMDLQRIILRTNLTGEPQTALNDQIWDVIVRNEFEQAQTDLYNNGLVEGRGYVVVWPDPELGVRLDVNAPQNMRVTYDPNDARQPIRAIKRWVTEEEEIRLTLYLPDNIYKYKLPRAARLQLIDPEANVPTDQVGWQPRLPAETGDPTWPLPNPFGIVPVVEFPNRTGTSELDSVIPLQDLLNKTLTDMAVSSEFGAFRQHWIVSSNKEPAGGWRASPGYVWHLIPEVDIDGRPLPTQVGSLDVTDPATYIRIVEMLLQHIASTTRTPHHMFLQTTKAGGRGDAPSGESMRVAETGLVKKIESLQRLWGHRWTRVARLIAQALQDFPDLKSIPIIADAKWAHPMAHYQTLLLEEAARMIRDLQLPPQYAWRHIGLTEAQIKEATDYMEAEEAKEEAKLQAELQARSSQAPRQP